MVSAKTPATVPAGRAGLPRDVAAERTRIDILRVATQEFAARGFGGARLEVIAEQMQTSKAMIYYYFGNKEGLYRAVVENVFSSIHASESIDRRDQGRDAESELRAYVEATFCFHEHHPEFSRIVSLENLNDAQGVGQLQRAKSSPGIGILAGILARGVAQQGFSADIDALDVHYFISALSVFRVTNRTTFKEIHDRDFADEKVRAQQLKMVVEATLRLLKAAPG